LNRPALVAHRLERELTRLQAVKLSLLEAQNAQLHRFLAAKDGYIAQLLQLLGLPGREAE
jgi:hypothetical protein